MLWCCLLHRETDISPFLTSISPVLSGQIKDLELFNVSISRRGVGVLVHSLTSPHCHLHELSLFHCPISSSDYCHLTTAIANSGLTHYISYKHSTDFAYSNVVVRALTQSKTQREVGLFRLRYCEVREPQNSISNFSLPSFPPLSPPPVKGTVVVKNCKDLLSKIGFCKLDISYYYLRSSCNSG